MVLVIVPWVALLLFVGVVAARIVRIARLPVHLRWELYPVAHEPNARYGGSFFERLDWWKHRREHARLGALKVMVPEILLLKGVHEHNRTLWLRSFPFHLGLYAGAASLALLVLGAILQEAGVEVAAGASFVGAAIHWLTAATGYTGLLLTFVGAGLLLLRRLGDPVLREVSTPGDFLNLGLFLATAGVSLAAVLADDRELAGLRALAGAALTFESIAGVPALHVAAVVLSSALLVYIPTTHMAHFVTKWFMYHDVRWDDAVNEVGSPLEAKIMRQLAYKVSWSAPHIQGGGQKTWVDVATEEVAKEKGR